MTLQLRSISLREAFGELLDVSPTCESLSIEWRTQYDRDLRQHFVAAGDRLRSAIKAYEDERRAEEPCPFEYGGCER